ncbi:MAG: phthiocerol/phenolphthiocerol synthesis type-I polyketide synthase, partial [Candidatus Eremiobacteraeota bacterium]|nr:phthiocerol/phenolphthiocerol synthesis type-I polyketide synthase [Candidatus Eremiobacteraeota bacterium]
MSRAEIERWLVVRLAERLGLAPESIETDQPIFAYGIDSVFATALSAELSERLGRPLDPTVLFEFPTIELVSAYLTTGRPAASPETKPRAVLAERGDVAIVGIACRMPGSRDKEAFWRRLVAGHDAISPLPAGRWDFAPDAVDDVRLPTQGGFIDGIDEFDAAFFRIAPTEARSMDPQQRILLQLVWEALEDAGCPPSRVRGTRGGVFVGVSSSDYGQRQYAGPSQVSAFSGTGNALSIIANRVSYFYDLRGPSMAVDTACSSSLVALHLAVASLRDGDCELALVCGVNLTLSGEVTLGLARAGMLAPDGRCRAFDAAASGYVRGEGGGVVVLKPLARALADGDRVYAVVKGSALNQDGRSNGLTAPNPASQEEVLRDAYRRAGEDPAAVDYVEAHGTGTALGDPIEALALSRVLCAGRPPERPLLVGSVKTNIGHLEAAAGIAGLIKTALALHEETLPGTLHFATPNPRIDFAALALEVVASTRPWPQDGAPHLCGVSSFGFGGANAHVVLEQIPRRTGAPLSSSPDAALVALSSATGPGLRELAERWAAWLAEPSAHERSSLRDIAYTSLARRDHLPARHAFVVGSKEELREQLSAFAATAGTDDGVRHGAPRRTLFVYPGQGRHWLHFGAEVLERDPLVRSVIRRCDETARAEGLLDWSIEAALRTNAEEVFADAIRSQPCIVAVQLALTALLQSYGIEPAAVIGHSVGEIAAACAAGVLEPGEALRLAVERGKCMALQTGAGASLALAATSEEASLLVAEHPGLDVAALNGPGAVTLSGDRAVLEALYRERAERGLASHWVSRGFAFHSHLMADAAASLERHLDWLTPRAARCAFFSTVSGAACDGAGLDAAYWARNVREPVAFAAALDAALADDEGFAAVVEIAPQPVLQSSIERALRARARAAVVVAASTPGEDSPRRFLRTIGRLYEAGLPVRHRVLPGPRPQVVSLPPYAWRRDRFWLDRVPPASRAWETVLDVRTRPSLLDHRVGGRVLVPAAAQIALMANALAAERPHASLELHDGAFPSPIVLGDRPFAVQTIVDYRNGRPAAISVRATDPQSSAEESAVYSRALVVPSVPNERERVDLHTLEERCASRLAAEELYDALESVGLAYGPSFRLVRDLRVGNGEALALLDLPADGVFETGAFDPRVLDAAFHPLLAAARTLTDGGEGLGTMPIGFARFRSFAPLTAPLYAHATINDRPSGKPSATVRLLDRDGLVLLQVDELLFAERAREPASPIERLFTYETVWRERPEPAASSAADLRYAVLLDRGGVGAALAAQVVRAGHRCAVIAPVDDPGDYKAAFERVAAEFGSRLDVVVNLRGLDLDHPLDVAGTLPTEGVDRTAVACLEQIKALTFAPLAAAPLVVFATSGVHGEAMGPPASRPAAAVVGGLARVLPFENPSMVCRCVDLVPGSSEELADELFAETLLRDGEIEVLRRAGHRFVRRIVQTHLARRAGGAVRLRADGVYLVTGGTGGIGSGLIEWLVERGARRIVALGRKPPAAAFISL